MSSAKGNRGIINHRRIIGRIRAGNALFNNDQHHDSHEFIQWLIDEIHMNVSEDFKFSIAKKLTSKEYAKEAVKNNKTMPSYSQMSPGNLDNIILKKLMPKYKSWVQLLFEG